MSATYHVAIFSKPPVAGEVKTRLIPAIGPDGAAELHHRLLRHTLRTVCQTSCARSLWIAGEIAHPTLLDASHDFGIGLRKQEGGDLGARMKQAMLHLLPHAETVALIGTDCPVLEARHLEQVSAALHSGAEVAVIPAADGGYVLIGVAHTGDTRLDTILGALFDDMPWSTDRVMSLTRDRLQAISATWHELPDLWDVDRPEDLMRLNNTLREPSVEPR
ncbi:glycosyltransferase [bacterium]|nr:MAG: glycosyltransferase [bacterium]